MSLPSRITPQRITDLPHALRDRQLFTARLAGRRPAVFLDYDGTLTPIVDRPEDAVITEDMRDAVRRLAARTTVCVVSGRDRPLVTQWMGIEGLVVAGSHGFDLGDRVGDHGGAALPEGFGDLLAAVTDQLRAGIASVPGALVEPKRFSVAVHYRLAEPARHALVAEVVDAVLAGHPGQLKLTPGKMVYEIQPNIDWDKGKAVRYLRHVLGVDGPECVSLYLGDDITDEDAFSALRETGIGVVVADCGDPEQAGRVTAAEFVLESVGEVRRFLDSLA
ncbi:MAG TPA: trehalose-phosphatase [Pseudonocardiaceae bacterium]|nr:trehalose-phosphatase [Pseudonocardiaceae bacterium]